LGKPIATVGVGVLVATHTGFGEDVAKVVRAVAVFLQQGTALLRTHFHQAPRAGVMHRAGRLSNYLPGDFLHGFGKTVG